MKARFLALAVLFMVSRNLNAQLQKDLKNFELTLQNLKTELKKLAPISSQAPQTGPVHEDLITKLRDRFGEIPIFFNHLRTLTREQAEAIVNEFLTTGLFPPIQVPSPGVPVAPGAPAAPPAPAAPGTSAAPPAPPAPGAPLAPGIGQVPAPRIEGLTETELKQLEPKEWEESNKVLLSVIELLGKPMYIKNGNSSDLQRTFIEDKFKALEKAPAKAKGFRFKKDYSPVLLAEAINKFIEENLLLRNKNELLLHLNNILQSLESGELQKQMIQLFEPWILGTALERENFYKKIQKPVEGLIINIVAAIRSDSAPEMVDPNSPQAVHSDTLFTELFLQKYKNEKLIEQLNLLRINPVYLKFTSLQNDVQTIKKAQSEKIAKPETEKYAPKPEELAEALKKIQEKKHQVKEPKAKAEESSKSLKEGIVAILEKQKGTIKAALIDDTYLDQYLFNPRSFDSALEALKGYLGLFVVKRLPSFTFDQYLTKVVEQAASIDDVIKFLNELSNSVEWAEPPDAIDVKVGTPTIPNKILLAFEVDGVIQRSYITIAQNNLEQANEFFKMLFEKLRAYNKRMHHSNATILVNYLTENYSKVAGTEINEDIKNKLEALVSKKK